MIVPNIGDRVALTKIGRFTLYSTIAKVNSYSENTKTWEVDIRNGRDRADLRFVNSHEPDYHFDTVPVTLKDKSYAGNDWELAGANK